MYKEIRAIPTEFSPGGVVKTATLLKYGWSKQEIRKAVDTKVLHREREGWYSARGAHQRVVQAVRAGGILGCASAIAFHGGWNLHDGRVHIYCAQRQRRKARTAKKASLARAVRPDRATALKVPGKTVLGGTTSTVPARTVMPGKAALSTSDESAKISSSVQPAGRHRPGGATDTEGPEKSAEAGKNAGRPKRLRSARTRRQRKKNKSLTKGCPSPKCHKAYQVGVLPLADALMQSVFCLSPDDFLVLAESLIYRTLMTRDQVHSTMAGINNRITELMKKLDVSESGTETLVRLRLRRRRVKLTPQVTIQGVGRVDFLVGKRLIIEVDSVDHHGSDEAFERDRARDQDLVALGFVVIRISYQQVMYDWPRVEARILRILRLGLHLRALPQGTPVPVVTLDQDHQDYRDDLDRE